MDNKLIKILQKKLQEKQFNVTNGKIVTKAGLVLVDTSKIKLQSRNLINNNTYNNF